MTTKSSPNGSGQNVFASDSFRYQEIREQELRQSASSRWALLSAVDRYFGSRPSRAYGPDLAPIPAYGYVAEEYGPETPKAASGEVARA